MNIYKISEDIDDSSIFIDRRDMGDRIRFVLCVGDDKDEYEDIDTIQSGKRGMNGILIKKEIGRLVIQFNLDKKYGILTAFWIDPEFRGKGWGKKMLQKALNDPKATARPILVDPNPFSEDAEMQVPELVSMYKHFGFKPFEDNWLIFNK